MNNTNVNNDYGAEQITVLDDRTAVRTRVAMYLGSSAQPGINQCIKEAIDNSVDEFLAGFGKEINISVYKNCAVRVVDHGRGMPAGPHPTERDKDGNPKDTMTLLVTELHAGGKFGKEDSGYKVSSGMHGVGISCVNFVSDSFEVISRRNNKQYKQSFSKGIPTGPVEVTDYDTDTNGTGTEVYYHPDKEIFKLTLEPGEEINSRLKELAILNPGLKINYKNEISKIDTSYYFKDGIREYITTMIGDKQKLFDEVLYINDNFESPENGLINVDIAFIYDDETEPGTKLKSFANNINTYEGGFHLNGFRNALKTELNKFIETKKLAKNPVEIKYILDGLYAVISIKLTNAEFEGQTKTKLGSYICQEAVETVMERAFKVWTKKNTTEIEAIANRALKVKEAEEAARLARSLKRQSKKASSKTVLPGKLSDCSNSKGYRELFITEGLSAAGSAKEGRYREFQAVLPLRGKILNVLKANEKKVLESETVQTIIGSLGAGWGDDFDPEDCRYDKIIIFTDADTDGYHIKSLLLTLFSTYMPGLIESGRVYSACPPLYRIIKPDSSSIYLFDDSALKKYQKEHKNERYVLNRFKGLGEMNPEQLKETAMCPKTRTLEKIEIEDIEVAKTSLEIYMGTDIEKRRYAIDTKAFSVSLDSL